MAIERREFDYSEKDFKTVKNRIYDIAGISLSDHKIQLVYSRLAPRLRANGIKKFSDYLDFIGEDNDELNQFVNALTTNKTSFFREQHHFDYLQETILPTVLKKQKHLKIWSAGCSTGEEPYTIAMSVDPYVDSFTNGVNILATDLDTKVLEKAKSGIYDYERIEGIDDEYLRNYFLQGKGSQKGLVKVSSGLRELITFNQLNLMEKWPFKRKFDVVFCRNVVIYFDKETQKKLFNRFCEQIVPGGWLMVGHSESLGQVQDQFEFIGQTIYQKKV